MCVCATYVCARVCGRIPHGICPRKRPPIFDTDERKRVCVCVCVHVQIRVLVIPTDEELSIAQQTAAVIEQHTRAAKTQREP